LFTYKFATPKQFILSGPLREEKANPQDDFIQSPKKSKISKPTNAQSDTIALVEWWLRVFYKHCPFA
jgi:hypothetical protein